jgi:galacturan 1,4-alpha-galacturonidase
MYNATGTGVFYITQCTTFSGVAGDCNTSLFNIHDVKVTNITGYVGTSYIASMQCSADSPCTGIEIEDVNVHHLTPTGALDTLYTCKNVEDTIGFSC